MLVLSRKVNEGIAISGPCVIEIVKISGNRVSIGFVAEKSTHILRLEIADAPTKRDPRALEGTNDAQDKHSGGSIS